MSAFLRSFDGERGREVGSEGVKYPLTRASIRRHVRLSLVFFVDESARRLQMTSFIRLARRVLIAHLERALCAHVTLMEYPSVFDAAFQERLRLVDPHWVMLVDPSSQLAGAESDYWNHLVKSFLCIHKRPAVLLPGLEFRGNDVWAWSISVPGNHAKIGKLGKNLDKSLIGETTSSTVATLQESDLQRAIECASSCIENTFIRAMVRRSADLCRDVPLEARCVCVGKADPIVLRNLEIFCQELLPYAHVPGMHDCVDGRLVHALVESKGGVTTQIPPISNPIMVSEKYRFI